MTMNKVTQRSLPELVNRAKSTLETNTGTFGPAINSLSACIAALTYGNYGYLDQLVKEMQPETCSEPWLYIYAARVGAPRILPTFARGFVRFEQLSDPVTIFEGTRIKFNDLLFETVNTQQSDQDIEVIAVQTGIESNLPENTELSLVTAVSGINPNKVLCLGFGGGADLEYLEAWRERVISATSNVQKIGKAEDYEDWATAAHSDVQIAWALDNTPVVGHVKVIVCKREFDPTLSPQVLGVIDNYFEYRRLAGCHPFAANPELVPVDFRLSGVNSLVVREAITTEIRQFLIAKMGIYDRDTNKLESISPTDLIVRINTITNDFLLHEPSAVLQPENDQVLTFGTITWI